MLYGCNTVDRGMYVVVNRHHTADNEVSPHIDLTYELNRK